MATPRSFPEPPHIPIPDRTEVRDEQGSALLAVLEVALEAAAVVIEGVEMRETKTMIRTLIMAVVVAARMAEAAVARPVRAVEVIAVIIGAKVPNDVLEVDGQHRRLSLVA
jgi:hypothetical protein